MVSQAVFEINSLRSWPPMSDSTTVGARPLATAYDPSRFTLGLYARNGVGKTAGAASFCGGEAGKGLVLNIEAGVVNDAGGATTIQHLAGIYDHVTQDDFSMLDVRDWQDAENQIRWLQREAPNLVEDGFTTLIMDSGTDSVQLLKRALTRINPANLKGNVDKHGQEDSAKKNHKRALVPWIDGKPGRGMEFDDWEYIADSFFFVIATLKGLPFRLIVTFTEGEGYDENTGMKMGYGPSTEGQKIGKSIMGKFNAFFHCRVAETGQHMWLTQNTVGATDSLGDPYWAKHRYGLKLDRLEPANGLALMKKIGVLKCPRTEEEEA